MAITITIETGAGLAAANSYVTVAELRTFALNRGVDMTLKSDDEVAAMLIQACDWLETIQLDYIGRRTYPIATDTHPEAQALAWPRTYNCVDLGVPVCVRQAQCFCAIAVFHGVDLLPTVDPSVAGIIKEKIGDLEVGYQNASTTDRIQGPYMSAALGFLSPVLKSATGGAITVYRA